MVLSRTPNLMCAGVAVSLRLGALASHPPAILPLILVLNSVLAGLA